MAQACLGFISWVQDWKQAKPGESPSPLQVLEPWPVECAQCSPPPPHTEKTYGTLLGPCPLAWGIAHARCLARHSLQVPIRDKTHRCLVWAWGWSTHPLLH
uniref:Uncharacterized protein n=1 Tax=Eutreptiella gymnastica TaxID=73025 RepID=A0A7S1IX87_9EUGL